MDGLFILVVGRDTAGAGWEVVRAKWPQAFGYAGLYCGCLMIVDKKITATTEAGSK